MNQKLEQEGFEIIEDIYSKKEIEDILRILKDNEIEDKFGVREILIKIPSLAKRVFSKKLIQVIKRISANCNKSIKSIYFDKPPNKNWIVNWHQDLTINVAEKKDIVGFKNWRIRPERTTVQPNIEMLQSIFTIRVHLDDCTKENGALRIIKKSHKKGIINIKEWIKEKKGTEKICEVKQGGVLIIKPLTLHSSRRADNNKNRRIIHIEFTDKKLPKEMRWKEKIEIIK